ncbi:hypothetical protein HGRIS_011634 [Hohenbuehelia grisea]|uniref:alpha-1,2-Mannosidase n=1 Tax=Hohenbuehelia grisea TaxID=104357 RepID=A0ABR3JXW4_9AGAR
MHSRSFALTLTLFTTVFTILSTPVSAGLVQVPGLQLPSDASKHRDDVKEIFVKSYQAYKEHAFGHDELAPVSEAFRDTRNGWGATIIDAMSTMFIMDLEDLFNEAVNFASQIDFSKSKTDSSVSVFETTIRYLGGLLSAYELSGQHTAALVDRAKELGDKLAHAWIGDKDIPYSHLDFNTNQPDPQHKTSNIAEAGTLVLEWSLLSQFTGNETYRDLAEQAFKHIARSPSPLPGLPAQGINPDTGDPVGAYVTWGGGSDSYLEYLIKYARLTNAEDPTYVAAWKTAVDSSIKHLLRRSTVGNHLYLADYHPEIGVIHSSSHLACFHGGNWILGGKLLNNDTIVDYGLELTDACWNTYASTHTGLGPETFEFMSPNELPSRWDVKPTAEQLRFYNEHGFFISASNYYMRPEVLESNFYAWRATGDTKYLDRAASAIESINKFLSVNGAFAGIEDVDAEDTKRTDIMESFWFAEVLKYLYLTFDDPSRMSLDEYVFNTEAQPFKAPAAKESYDTGTLESSQAPFKTKEGELPEVSPIPTGLARIVGVVLG